MTPNVEVMHLTAHSGPIRCMQFNSEGKYLFSGGDDRVINLWNPFRPYIDGSDSGGMIIKQYKGHGYDVADIAVAKDGSKFASCGGDKFAIIWDITSGKEIRRLHGHSHRLTSCVLNEESSVLVTSSLDKTIRFWDLRTAPRSPSQLLQTTSDFSDSVTSLCLSKSCLYASSLDGTLKCFDLRSAKRTSFEFGVPLSNCCLTSDENCALVSTTSESGAMLLMDLSSNVILTKYSGYKNTEFRITPTLSSNDSLVVIGDELGDLYYYDIVDGSLVCRLSPHKKPISAVVASASGNRNVIVSGSFDGTAKVFMNQANAQEFLSFSKI